MKNKTYGRESVVGVVIGGKFQPSKDIHMGRFTKTQMDDLEDMVKEAVTKIDCPAKELYAYVAGGDYKKWLDVRMEERSQIREKAYELLQKYGLSKSRINISWFPYDKDSKIITKTKPVSVYSLMQKLL